MFDDRDESIRATAMIPEMQELADLVFSVLHLSCPQFMAIELCVDGAFGTYSWTERRQGHRFGYLRSTRVDHYGQRTVVGNPISVDMIRYHEPNDEIFRFRRIGLGRSCSRAEGSRKVPLIFMAYWLALHVTWSREHISLAHGSHHC